MQNPWRERTISVFKIVYLTSLGIEGPTYRAVNFTTIIIINRPAFEFGVQRTAQKGGRFQEVVFSKSGFRALLVEEEEDVGWNVCGAVGEWVDWRRARGDGGWSGKGICDEGEREDGVKIVDKVCISVTKGAVESFFVVFRRWDSLMSRGLVCGGRAEVVTLFSMSWTRTSESQWEGYPVVCKWIRVRKGALAEQDRDNAVA